MAKKVIKTTLSADSLDKAIKELRAYRKWVEQKSKELAERLAILGAYEATVRFSGAYYDGDNDVQVRVDPIPNGYKIVAQGNAVFFIEFGAGVYFNGNEPYPVPRPPGIVDIGEYGDGKGKQDVWGYYDGAGDLILTHGNPAAMPMYHATREIEDSVRQIAKEVFK